MTSLTAARYRDVLALPHVRLTFLTSLAGRAAYALVLLPLLYAVNDATDSVALAGTAVALYGATASFLAPVRAWLIDRFGARRTLTILILAFGSALGAMATLSLTAGPPMLMVALAAVAGSVAPPLGPTMRVAWGTLAPEPPLLRKALSLDSVVEELLYLAGPALAGLALALVSPGVALLVPALLVVVGGLTFISTPTITGMAPRHTDAVSGRRDRPLILEPRFVALVLPALVAGGVSGTLSVAVPVALDQAGGPAAAGIALGLFAGGSAVGGLTYGALRVPGSAARQLVLLAAALLTALALVAVVSGAVGISLVLLGAGLFFSPVMIVAYVAAQGAGGKHRQNSATTWINTGHNLGGAAGSAAAGVTIQMAGVPAAVLTTVVAGLLLLATSALLGRHRVATEVV